MIFIPTLLEGAFLVAPEPIADDRGYFARTFDRDAFAASGLETEFPQWSISHNRRRGTLRGMHYQAAPWEEAKLVGCARGAIYDVLLDVRPRSPSFRRWVAVEVQAHTPRLVYVPKGVAHGFQTLEDDTLVTYQISALFHAEAARGIRWNDSAFSIEWPLTPTCISEKDKAYAPWEPPRPNDR